MPSSIDYMSEVPNLYTPEAIIFRSGLDSLNTDKLAVPVTVYLDQAGNHALAHGNHRAYHFYLEGKLDELQRKLIGFLPKDISQDPYYHPVSELKIVER